MENEMKAEKQELTPVVQQQTPDQELNAVQGFAKFMDDGGIFMWIILGIWVFGVAVAVERFKSLFQYDVDGTSLMNEVKKSVLTNEVQAAIQKTSGSKSLSRHRYKERS